MTKCELSISHSVSWVNVFQIWLTCISKPDSIPPDLQSELWITQSDSD